MLRRQCRDHKYNMTVTTDPRDGAGGGLTPEQQAWARHSENLWRTAHRIAAANPEHDPSDLYHALRALERTPTERLRVSLQRGRLRTYAR